MQELGLWRAVPFLGIVVQNFRYCVYALRAHPPSFYRSFPTLIFCAGDNSCNRPFVEISWVNLLKLVCYLYGQYAVLTIPLLFFTVYAAHPVPISHQIITRNSHAVVSSTHPPKFRQSFTTDRFFKTLDDAFPRNICCGYIKQLSLSHTIFLFIFLCS